MNRIMLRIMDVPIEIMTTATKHTIRNKPKIIVFSVCSYDRL